MRNLKITLLTLALATCALPVLADPPAQAYPGYDTTFLDRSVKPQDDFYHFALGGYEKTHPIPADLPLIGIYTDVREHVLVLLHNILDGVDGPPGSNERKLHDFYHSGMDLGPIQAAGMKPIQPELDRISKINSHRDLEEELARLQRAGLDLTFRFGATPDPKNPEVWIAEAEQGGLGLPSREYYLDPKRAKIRNAYQQHVDKMFQLLGSAPAESAKSAEAVMRIETALAQCSLLPAELRDPKARFHPMDRAELARLTPSFSWPDFFDRLGISRVQSINVATPKFFTGWSEVWASAPLSDWKTYLTWRYTNATANFLSLPFEDEQFEFSRNLTGVPKKPERWKKMVALTDAHLGQALGKLFVEKHFSPAAKAMALEMIGNVQASLRDRIEHGWMSPTTRQQALIKLDAMHFKIGYPNQWKSYDKLAITPGLLIDNVLKAKAFESQEDLDKIGTAVNHEEWDTTPATVNAFYNPSANEICFPAGRLQPPFFDVNSDAALNYGATGATMGHEMSHGFDDEGAQFDAHGALRDWWTPEDLARFTRKGDSVASQMSEMTFDGQTNNGKLVEGEAIADQAGVRLGFMALKRALANKPLPVTRDGFTPWQRFYLGYALCRASNARLEFAHALMTRDPHPLGLFRVNGPLCNEPDFYEAFNVKPGDKMRRDEAKRIRLWDAETP